MRLSTATREKLVDAAYHDLLRRAEEGTINTADPLRQLIQLDAAWQDPEASWSLATSLLRMTDQGRSQVNGSAGRRSQINLVYRVTLAIYDQARIQRLGGAVAVRGAVAHL